MSLPLPPGLAGALGGGPPGGPGPGDALWNALDPALVAPTWGQPLQAPPPDPTFVQAPPPLDEGTARDRASRVVALWSPRDMRMGDDQDIYDLLDTTSEAGSTVTRNTPRVVVDKISAMIGSNLPVIRPIPPHQGMDTQRDAIKALLEWLWSEWDREFANGGSGTSLGQAMAWYAAQRGWLAARVSYDPGAPPDELPVHLDLIDPWVVYPQYNGRKLAYVVHKQYMLLSEIIDQFPESAPTFGSQPETNKLEVIAYYDDQVHAVFVAGTAVKPPTPHGYGFLPWVITTANGTPARGDPRGGAGNQWTERVGPAIYDSIKNAYRETNKVLSQLADIVATASHPPVIVSTKPGVAEPEAVSLEAGATNYVLPGEDIRVITAKPSPTEVGPLLNALTQDIEYGSLPRILFSAADPNQSGLAISLLSGAARDALYGIITALQRVHEEVNRMALSLIRDLAQQPIGIVVRDGQGGWVGGTTVAPADIDAFGVRTKVSYRDVTAKDRFQLMQLAVALTGAKLVSKRYAREEYLDIADPERENREIMAEAIYSDPDFMKGIGVPFVLSQDHPDLFAFWQAQQRFADQQQQQNAAPPGPPGPPGPGGPPPSAPGAPPMPGGIPGVQGVPGSPPTPLPAQMGASPINPAVLAIANARGGAGQQRTPGAPGFGGQIPFGLSPR